MEHEDKLELKPEFLVSLYEGIDSKARQLAPQYNKNELTISQDGRIKTRFYVVVSNRMAPHFITAIQQQIDLENGLGLRCYLVKLQEQVMSKLLGDHDQRPINVEFDTRSFFPTI
jgi:hypothetical protein